MFDIGSWGRLLWLVGFAVVATSCSGTTGTDCVEEAQCSVGETCDEQRCRAAPALTILGEDELLPATVGGPYASTINVEGGSAPYTFGFSRRPDALSWLRLDQASGALSGTPDSAAPDGLTIQVTVSDRSRQRATRSFHLRILACQDGAEVQCFSAQGDACGRGTAICVDGEIGPCSIEELSSDPGHCGGDGTSCGSCGDGADGCVDGRCSCGDGSACGEGTQCCGDGESASCLDVREDPNNCGGCGIVCQAGPNAVATCRDGQCVKSATCTAPYGACDPARPDDCVVNTDTSSEHCGVCGNTCSPSQATGCVDGTCACGEGPSCMGGETCCGTAGASCVDLTVGSPNGHSVTNCGECGRSCQAAHGNGTATCEAGECVKGCQEGWKDCSNGAEVVPPNSCNTYVAESVEHCGACGNNCLAKAGPGVTTACVAGQCEYYCEQGHSACEGAGGSISCKDQTSNLSCGTSCAPPVTNYAPPATYPNTSQSLATCCTGLDANGQCSAACVRGVDSASCVYGLACNEDYGNCEGGLADGCETSLLHGRKVPLGNGKATTTHCGQCEKTCSLTANAREMKCDGGSCKVGLCEPGFLDLDGKVENGCEVDTRSNAEHCGRQGNRCVESLPNVADAVCVDSVCKVVSCQEGWGDCGSGLGCETNLDTDSSSCGACGVACGSGGVCTSGECCRPCGADQCCKGSCGIVKGNPVCQGGG